MDVIGFIVTIIVLFAFIASKNSELSEVASNPSLGLLVRLQSEKSKWPIIRYSPISSNSLLFSDEEKHAVVLKKG
jgi:hypothetical protein